MKRLEFIAIWVSRSARRKQRRTLDLNGLWNVDARSMSWARIELGKVLVSYFPVSVIFYEHEVLSFAGYCGIFSAELADAKFGELRTVKMVTIQTLEVFCLGSIENSVQDAFDLRLLIPIIACRTIAADTSAASEKKRSKCNDRAHNC